MSFIEQIDIELSAATDAEWLMLEASLYLNSGQGRDSPIMEVIVYLLHGQDQDLATDQDWGPNMETN